MSRPEQEFEDDGTLRRKYDIEVREESRAGLATSVGLVVASSLLLMRNLLFGETAPAAASASAAQPASPGTIREAEATAFEHEDKDEQDAPSDREGAPSEVASKLGVLLGPMLTPVRIYEGPLASAVQRRAALTPTASNDNERLYSAAQGSRIDLSSFEASFDGNWSRFGGEGGGGADSATPPRGSDPPPPAPTRTNRLPVVTGPVVLAGLPMNQSTLIAVSDLLRNVSDPDGDTLHIQGLTASTGTLVARGNGLYAYMPALGDTTSVVFSYEVSDGEASVAQVAYLDLLPVAPVTIPGTDGDDTLIGTPAADIIDGGDGDDRIHAREGDDIVYGGAGDDTLFGGDGNDVIYGEAGNDVIYGGAGNDRLFGGDGDDILFGEEGDDVLFGEAGNDHLFGGSGMDVLIGGAGADVLDGGAGADRVFGEEGDDIILARDGDGNDQYDGGEGIDTYDAGAVQGDMTIDLAEGTATGAAGEDTLANIENVIAGAGDDVVVGDGAANVLDGGAGDDQVHGGAGDDILLAYDGDGNDHYDGGEGIDTYDAGAVQGDMTIDLEQGTATGAAGEDTLANIDNVIAGAGNDVIVANDAVNELTGGLGNDVFVFRTSKAIGKGAGGRDKILDFGVGDRIDLDDIHKEFEDAVEDHLDDHDIKKFTLIGMSEQFSRPGEIRFKYDEVDGKAVTIIQGNLDRDPEAEFELELLGTIAIRADYFQT